MNPKSPRLNDCPCGSGRKYAACCGRYLASDGVASTAEELMRSRYSAYVLQRDDYLLSTWHPSTRPPRVDLNTVPQVHWLGLKVLNSEAGKPGDTTGTVEFVARCKQAGKASRLYERSRFVYEDARWFYVDGELRE